MNERRNDLEIVMNRAIVLRDPTRIDLLFTMSEIPQADPCSGSRMRSDVFADELFGYVGSAPARLRSCELRRGSLRHDPARRAVAASKGWWSQTGSNRRPHACKARALPAELWPRNQKTNALCVSRARLRLLGSGAAAFVQEGLPSRSCKAAKAGGPGKT